MIDAIEFDTIEFDTIEFEPDPGREETAVTDAITIAVWAALGLVLVVVPLVMACLG
jgi:hypothetical protein